MRNQTILRHAADVAVMAALLSALAACGGGGSDSNGNGNGNGNGASNTIPSGQVAADSFFDQVYALVTNGSDSADPVPIDGFAASVPENAVPKNF